MQSVIDRYWKPLLFIGVVVYLVAQPSYIGWWVYDANTANSIGGKAFYGSRFLALYGPHDTARWLWEWHADPAFMALFRQSVVKGFWVAAIAVAAFGYMAHVNGPLPAVETEEQPHRYGTVEDLLELGRVSLQKPGIVLGRDGKRPVYHTGDDHVLLIGASRVGEKGTSFVLPTLADCPAPMVVFDPKGALFEGTADERAKRGPVHLFDVTRAGCAKFNPLQELRGGGMNIADCEMQGALMTYGMEGRDPFWAKSAAQLIAGLVREACLSQARPTYKHVLETFQRVRVDQRPPTQDQFVQDRVSAFFALVDRARSGVQAEVELALRFASDPMTLSALSRSEWNVGDLLCGRALATVYLTFPPSQKEVQTQVVRLVLQAIFMGMTHHRHQVSDGRRKVHPQVVWMIDEFPQLGHLHFIEDAMRIAAEYGVKMFLVCQDISDIEQSYGRDQSITKNCGHLIFSSLSDTGYEHATKLCGTMIAPMRARHRKIGVFDRQSETASQSRHPVLNPRDARLLTRDHALVLATVGAKPVWLEKARYYEMSCYRGRIRDTRWVEG